MKNKKGFTLVELLAVIVILAIILVIAVPQIMKVIRASRLSAIQSTANLIISKADEKIIEDQVLDKGESLICSELTKMSDDYGSCVLSYDDDNKVNIRIKGKENGKFAGIICEGTKDNLECTEGNASGATFLPGEEVAVKIKKLANPSVSNVSSTYIGL